MESLESQALGLIETTKKLIAEQLRTLLEDRKADAKSVRQIVKEGYPPELHQTAYEQIVKMGKYGFSCVEDITKEWTVEEEGKERRLFLLHSLKIVGLKLRKAKMKRSLSFPHYVLDQMIAIADYIHDHTNIHVPQRTIWLFLSFLLDGFEHLNVPELWLGKEEESNSDLLKFLNRHFGLTDCQIPQLQFVEYKKRSKQVKSEMVSFLQ